jgi:hypothetical protein
VTARTAEMQCLERLERFPMGLERHAAVDVEEVGEEIELARRGDGRIEDAHRARGGVARIGEALRAGFVLLAIEILERLSRHHRLPAHFEIARQAVLLERGGIDAQRDRADGPDIGGDVLASGSIAARHAAHQRSIFIDERKAQAVEFVFGYVFHLLALGTLARAAVEIAQLVVAIGVVEAQHRRGMAHGAETLARFAADTLGGRIVRYQFGMLRFERLQFVHQAIEPAIGDRRLVEHVIAVFVLADFAAQPLDFFNRRLGYGHGGGLEGMCTQPLWDYTMRFPDPGHVERHP